MDTYTTEVLAALDRQQAFARKQAVSALTRGYYLRPVVRNDRTCRLSPSAQTSMRDLVYSFSKRRGVHVRPPVCISLWHQQEELDRRSADAGHIVLDDEIVFSFTLPRLKRYSQLIDAMLLWSRERDEHHATLRPGVVLFHKYSDRYEFTGRGKSGLEAVVALFSHPEHQDILRKG